MCRTYLLLRSTFIPVWPLELKTNRAPSFVGRACLDLVGPGFSLWYLHWRGSNPRYWNGSCGDPSSAQLERWIWFLREEALPPSRKEHFPISQITGFMHPGACLKKNTWTLVFSCIPESLLSEQPILRYCGGISMLECRRELRGSSALGPWFAERGPEGIMPKTFTVYTWYR